MNTCNTPFPAARSASTFLADLRITLTHDRIFNIEHHGDVEAILDYLLRRLAISKPA
jgi:hypothetical protein